MRRVRLWSLNGLLLSLLLIVGILPVRSADTGIVWHIALPDMYPQVLAQDDRTGRVFVALSDRNQVAIVSSHNGSLLRTTAVGANPSAIVVDSAGGHVFVANQDDDSMSMLDARSGQVLRTEKLWLAAYPGATLLIDTLILDSTDARLYVTGGTGRVTMLDTRSGKVLRTIRAVPDSSFMPGGSMVWDGRQRLYLLQPFTARSSEMIGVIDAPSLRLLYSVKAAPDAQRLAVDGHAARLFVSGNSTLHVVDTRSNVLVRQTTAPALYTAPVMDEMSGRVFIAGAGNHTIFMLDSRTGAVQQVIRTATLSGQPLVDITRHRLYVPTLLGVTVVDARTGATVNTLPAGPTLAVSVSERTGRIAVLSAARPSEGSLNWLPGVVSGLLPNLISKQSHPQYASLSMLDNAPQ